MRLLAIDPGLYKLGCAVFDSGVLVRAFEVTRERGEGFDRDVGAWRETVDAIELALVERPDRVVIEMMHVTPGDRGEESKINSLLQLVGVAGCVAGRFGCEMASYRPMNIRHGERFVEGWKPGTPKRPHHARILGRLGEREWNVLPMNPVAYLAQWPEKGAPRWHDVVDAVGIGLHDLGRYGEERPSRAGGETGTVRLLREVRAWCSGLDL